jgi:molybdopterin/thiamine biosynthesis adenylyltransferase
MNYIEGAGGGGSWLCPTICMLTGPDNVTVIDGDTLEEKNLNRQLYTQDDIGKNKADALAARYGCQSRPEFYYLGLIELDPRDWLLVCVDNMPARKSALESCDHYGCKAIFAANETNSAEAYLYLPEWKDSPLDPRVYYPEINKDATGDPRARAMGCTGEAQVATRQLVSSNFMSAALAQHLFVAWAIEARKMDAEARKFLPHKLAANLSKIESYSSNQTMKGQIK